MFCTGRFVPGYCYQCRESYGQCVWRILAAVHAGPSGKPQSDFTSMRTVAPTAFQAPECRGSASRLPRARPLQSVRARRSRRYRIYNDGMPPMTQTGWLLKEQAFLPPFRQKKKGHTNISSKFLLLHLHALLNKYWGEYINRATPKSDRSFSQRHPTGRAQDVFAISRQSP